MTSTLFESFMIFYLLEVIVLGVIAFQLLRDIKKETIEEEMRNNQESGGPSASDLIKMRALAKQMDRQK